MNRYKLFLDDERLPSQCVAYMRRRVGATSLLYDDPNWVVVKDFVSFCNCVEHNFLANRWWPEVVSFDHDLADEHYHHAMNEGREVYEKYLKEQSKEKTGYDCAVWFFEFAGTHQLELPHILIHTMNPVGLERIREVFKPKT